MNFQWIKTEEKLPEHKQDVLCLHRSGDMFVLTFVLNKEVNKKLKSVGYTPSQSDEGYEFCSKELSGNCLGNVTHWMRLPEKP